MQDMITLADVAERLGMSRSGVYKMAQRGLFPSAVRLSNRFIFIDPNTNEVLDITPNDGASNPTYDGSQTGCVRTDDYHCFSTADRFNFSQYNLLLTPSERMGAFGQVRFEFSDAVSGYAKVLYNRRESTNQAAPEPIFLGTDADILFMYKYSTRSSFDELRVRLLA